MFAAVCLAAMIVSYTVCICAVGSAYADNLSVSSLIKDNTLILQCMVIMGLFTLLYEWSRDNILSLLTIGCLLFTLYGLLLIDESYAIHYLFATGTITSINAFMWIHAHSWIAWMSTFAQTGLSLIIGHKLLTGLESIFFEEVTVIALFAAYYLGDYLSTCTFYKQ